jgi:hypothetical protein
MVGASTAAWAFHSLIVAAFLAGQAHPSFDLWWHDPSWLRSFWSDAVVLGLATWMIVGGRGIGDLVLRARTAGHRAAAVPADQPAE